MVFADFSQKKIQAVLGGKKRTPKNWMNLDHYSSEPFSKQADESNLSLWAI